MKDPIIHCPVYKTEGCAHVDGYLCEVETCPIITNWCNKVQKSGSNQPAVRPTKSVTNERPI